MTTKMKGKVGYENRGGRIFLFTDPCCPYQAPEYATKRFHAERELPENCTAETIKALIRELEAATGMDLTPTAALAEVLI